MNYLLDTNAVIDFTNGYLPLAAGKMISSHHSSLSFITPIELLAWPQLSLAQESLLVNYITACTVYGCSEAIILQTIALRKQYKLKLPDAMIAATAIVHNLTLLSRNLKDFKSITNLTTIDPHTL